MADQKKEFQMTPWDHWLDGVRDEKDIPAAVEKFARDMRKWCALKSDEQYAVMTQSNKYHGTSRHLHKTDVDDVTRMLDDHGKNTHFNENMTEYDLEMNTMSMLAEFAPEIVLWRAASPGNVGRLKLVMPIDPEYIPDGSGRVGSGLRADSSGQLHKYTTNAQTVILEKVAPWDDDAKDNPLGCRIITEYPCLESVDDLINALGKVKDHPYHVWYGHGSPDQQFAFRGINKDDDLKVDAHEVQHDLDAEDVYNGVARSAMFRSYNYQYVHAPTLARKAAIERDYESDIAKKGMQQAAPDVRGRRKEIPDKFEDIYKQAQALDESNGKSDEEKDS